MDYPENKTDRVRRLANFEAILKNASKVYVWGEDEDCNLFADYVTELGYSDNIYVINVASDIDVTEKSVVFLLNLDDDLCRESIIEFSKSGIKPVQIIPPGVFWTYILAEKKGFIKEYNLENFQFPILATIDTHNRCNLDCSTCGRVTEYETSDRMSFDLFKKILDKLQIIGIKEVELYNYTEPFMNPNIYEFMKEVKRRGIHVGISSNLSLSNIKNLKECVDLLEPGDWFVITISGVKQEIYEINHRRGDINKVIENLKIISQSSKSNLVTLRLLKFDYNRSEYEPAKELARKYNVRLQWFDAEGSPFETNYNKNTSKNRIENGISLNSYNKSYDHDGFFCRMIHGRNIVINCHGNVELCCVPFSRPYDLGSFLDQDFSVIQMKRDRHPICHKCYLRPWSQSLKDMIIHDEKKISNLLNHGMDTLCTIRRLHPLNFYNGIMSTDEYLKKLLDKLQG